MLFKLQYGMKSLIIMLRLSIYDMIFFYLASVNQKDLNYITSFLHCRFLKYPRQTNWQIL